MNTERLSHRVNGVSFEKLPVLRRTNSRDARTGGNISVLPLPRGSSPGLSMRPSRYS